MLFISTVQFYILHYTCEGCAITCLKSVDIYKVIVSRLCFTPLRKGPILKFVLQPLSIEKDVLYIK